MYCLLKLNRRRRAKQRVPVREPMPQVREMTWAWMLEYKEERDHDSLGGMTPIEALENAKSSTFELST